MKIFDIIRESLDAPIGSQTSSSPKGKSLLVIDVENINDAENALNNIDNYGKYTQNFVLDFEQNREKILGPRNFNKKMEAAIKQWDNFNKDEKRKKLEGIISFIGNEKWGEVISLLSDKGDEESIKDWISNNSFNDVKNATIPPKGSTSILFGSKASIYFPSNVTKDQLNKLLSSPMVKDINYTIDGNQIIFIPFKDPKGKPVTKAFLEKIIKTIMNNAQVKYNISQINPEDISTAPGKAPKAQPTKSTTPALTTTLETKEDAFDLRKELQKRFTIPSAVYKVEPIEDPETGETSAKLVITGLTASQRAQLQQFTTDYKYNLEEGLRRMKVRAGIIK